MSYRTQGQYSITTDNATIDIDATHAFLTRSFWAEGIPRDIVARLSNLATNGKNKAAEAYLMEIIK